MTRKKKCNSESNSFVAAAEQNNVFSLFLNTDSDEADVTSLGRPFHTLAAAAGKARLPIVDRRQVGTSTCSVEADLSLHSNPPDVYQTVLRAAPSSAFLLRYCSRKWRYRHSDVTQDQVRVYGRARASVLQRERWRGVQTEM